MTWCLIFRQLLTFFLYALPFLCWCRAWNACLLFLIHIAVDEALQNAFACMHRPLWIGKLDTHTGFLDVPVITQAVGPCWERTLILAAYPGKIMLQDTLGSTRCYDRKADEVKGFDFAKVRTVSSYGVPHAILARVESNPRIELRLFGDRSIFHFIAGCFSVLLGFRRVAVLSRLLDGSVACFRFGKRQLLMPGMASQSNFGVFDKPFPDLLEERPVNVGSDVRMRIDIVFVLDLIVFD